MRSTAAMTAFLLGFAAPPMLAGQERPDSSTHEVHFVAVDSAVTLEVLEWGGSGRPLVFLAGRGNTAHVFDDLAAKLVPDFSLFGVTRRGFGNSTYTTDGFLADELADDVLAVMDSLNIQRPILVGHSIAGQELSSIGSRHPGRVAGLVYVDAGFHFAYYDPSLGRAPVFMRDTQRKLERLSDLSVGMTVSERAALVQELLDRLPTLERDLGEYLDDLEAAPDPSRVLPRPDSNPVHRVLAAGQQIYGGIEAPALALVAHPPQYPPGASDPQVRARLDSIVEVDIAPRVDAFEQGMPSARVVRVPHANHYIFRSHEDVFLREIRAFAEELEGGVPSADLCLTDAPGTRFVVNGRETNCRTAMAIPKVRIAAIDVRKLRERSDDPETTVEIRTKAGG